MSAYELYESRNHTLAGKIVRGVRVFIVDSNPELALFDNQIPAKDTGFDFNGTKGYLRSYDVERYTPTQSKVTCNYDNDGSSRGPQLPDEQDPLYKNVNITYTRDTEKIPAFVLFIDPTPVEPGGPFVKVERWQPTDFIVDYYYATAEVTVNLPTMNAEIQRVIASNVNSIHEFPDGLYWLFTGATTTRTAEDQWQITYRWLHDSGQISSAPAPILMPDGSFQPITLASNLIEPGAMIIPTIDRDPFQKWRVIPASEFDDPPRPRIGVVPIKAFRSLNFAGWQTLPGHPIP